MQIAILLYPGTTALDAVGPYEVLSRMPDTDVRFVAKEVGPFMTDGGTLGGMRCSPLLGSEREDYSEAPLRTPT